MTQEVPNNFLAKLFSGEILTLAAVGLIAYGGMTVKVDATEDKLKEQERKIEAVQQDVGTIKTDVAVIKKTQENLSKGLEKQNEAQRIRQEETNRLLRHLIERTE